MVQIFKRRWRGGAAVCMFLRLSYYVPVCCLSLIAVCLSVCPAGLLSVLPFAQSTSRMEEKVNAKRSHSPRHSSSISATCSKSKHDCEELLLPPSPLFEYRITWVYAFPCPCLSAPSEETNRKQPYGHVKCPY